MTTLYPKPPRRIRLWILATILLAALALLLDRVLLYPRMPSRHSDPQEIHELFIRFYNNNSPFGESDYRTAWAYMDRLRDLGTDQAVETLVRIYDDPRVTPFDGESMLNFRAAIMPFGERAIPLLSRVQDPRKREYAQVIIGDIQADRPPL